MRRSGKSHMIAMLLLSSTLVLWSVMVSGCQTSSSPSPSPDQSAGSLDATGAVANGDVGDSEIQPLAAVMDVSAADSSMFPESTLPQHRIPASYVTPADQQGSVETVYYDTCVYAGDGEEVSKDALVYLPYGYDPADTTTRYNIVYMMHGSGGSEYDYMGEEFVDVLDHMIEDGLIAPMIFVSTTIDEGWDAYVTNTLSYQTELVSDLIPAVEGTYHTYADSTDEAGLSASRSHRAYAGFSLGAMVVWDTFINHLDCFEYFIPMSCDYVDMTSDVYDDAYDGLTSDESAQVVVDAARASGYTPRQYFIFAAGGTDDYLCDDLYMQLESMRESPDVFVWADNFTDGNVMFYLATGGQHSYWYSVEYLYNGLQQIFHEEA